MFGSERKRVPPQLIVTPRYRAIHSEYEGLNSDRSKNQPKKSQLSSFQILKQIGQGKQSKVILAIKNGEKYAMKVVDKIQIMKTKTQFQLQREILIMKQLDHPNIVKLIEEFSDEQNVYLIQEYCNQGSLFNKKFDQSQVKIILKHVLKALKYLHGKGIMHRDIKPENILIHNGQVKLGDFGIAHYTTSRRKSFCGTLDYMSPEIITQQYYDEKVDIWAIGILAYELSYEQPPMKDKDPNIQMRKICQEEIKYPKIFDPLLINFIEKCLKKLPEDRATIDNLLNDEYLQH